MLTILVFDGFLLKKKFRKKSVTIFTSLGSLSSPSTSILTYCKLNGTFELTFVVVEQLSSELDNDFQGDTMSSQSLEEYRLDRGWIDSNYYITFNPNFDNLFGDKLLIGYLPEKTPIDYITLTCYDSNDNIVIDFNGQPLIFTSSSHKFGHLIESLPRETNYYYIKLIFNLQSNSGFDPDKVFFHCSQSTSSTSIATPIATSTTDSAPESKVHSATEPTTDSTPESTADSTMESTTHSTSGSTTDSTPESTAHSTPDSTKDSTPESTVHSTIESTADSTIESTTDSTSESTTDSTSDSTVHSTPDSTKDSTPESTSTQTWI
ncbi:unnamed protein product [Adineta steineri]|uniref:Uncharacterized protein n=1 Tax=Adineta steineri TaxID=433720 RepID=A0A813Z7K9_9BILA|nr:unnamed protein product [Adineta steineri]